MAGRRGASDQVKESSGSLLIYLPMAAILIVMAVTMYTFGLNFGFISFGGNTNINVLYGGIIACIVLSYITDIMFIKAIKKFYRKKDNFVTYIPYFNFIGLLGKGGKITSYVIIVVILLVALPAYTPLGRFMPVDYLTLMATNSILIIIGAMAVFTFVRGFRCLKLKTNIEKFYRNNINDNYGSGGKVNTVAYVIYFLPIIRSISIFTDLNFINSVRLEAEDMHRKEER